MTQLERRNYPKANTAKIDGYIQKLQQSNRDTRPEFLRQTLSYVLSHVSIAVETITILSERKDKYSIMILDSLNPEKIIEYISKKTEKTAKKTDFEEIFDHLSTPTAEIAQAMLIGYLNQPIEDLEKVQKKQQTVEENRRSQQKTALKANKVGLNFAEALYEHEDETVREIVSRVLDENFAGPEFERNTLIDLLMNNSNFAQPPKEAALADEIIRYIDFLLKRNLDVNFISKYHQSPFIKDKNPRLDQIWEKTDNPQEHSYSKNHANMKAQFADRIENISAEPIVITADEPFSTKMGAEALRYFVAEMIPKVEEVKTRTQRKDIDYRFIPSSQGRFIFLIGKKEELEDTNNQLRRKVSSILTQHNATSRIESSITFGQVELNTFLEFLKPLDIDWEKIEKTLPVLIASVQGGLQGISKRGISTKISLPEEGFLRDSGLRNIYFKQEEAGIRVITDWSGGQISFTLDRNYQPSGLDRLSEENRKWLLTVVFSYMDAIKTHETGLVQFLNEEEEIVDGEQPIAEKTGRKIARMPHLRVLELGDRSQKIANKDSENEVEFHFGIGLSLLNAMFLQIQENQSLLTDSNSEFNQYFRTLPYGQTLKRLLERLIIRTQIKTSKPVWRSGLLAGQDVLQLLPSQPPSSYNPDTDIYMITFVSETELKGSKPREIRCPGVGRRILESALLEN